MTHPVDDLISKLDDSHYVADLFLLLHLAELDEATAKNTEVRLYVPESVDDLLMEDSDSSDDVLKALLLWARRELRCSGDPSVDMMIDDIRSKYAALRRFKFVETIPDEAAPEVK